MADARGHAQQNRHLPALGDLDGAHRELVSLLRVRGLEHGHPGSEGVAPVVLLVLARSHPRIVGRNHHQRPVQPDQRHGEQGVGGHIQPDVLHGDQSAGAGKGDTDPHLQRHLFVGRPLRSSTQAFKGFQYLRRGSTRISRAESHPGVEGGHGDRLVTAQQRQRIILPKTIQAETCGL